MTYRTVCVAWICLWSCTVVTTRIKAQQGSSATSRTEIDNTLHNPLENARIDSIDTDHSSVTLTDCPSKEIGGRRVDCLDDSMSPSIEASAKPQLAKVHGGDHTKVVFQSDQMKIIHSIAPRRQFVGGGQRFVALCLGYLLTLVMAVLFTRGHPLRLIIGADNRYSNSKFQMALWFSVLIAVYLAAVGLRLHVAGWDFFGGINIPAHLLALSGASALTFGVAKGITTAKVDAAVAAGAPNPKPAGTPNFMVDLVSNDLGNFDLGDFQMLVITLLAVGMFVATTFNSLGTIESLKTMTLPDVDTTILAAFGLGQGAYLTKKVAGNPATS